MEAALSTNNASLIASVSEGCTRVGMQVHDVSKSRATLSAVTSPTILLARSALDAIVKSSSLEGSGQAAGQVVAASQAVTSYLGVLRELIRFCDGPSRRGGSKSHEIQRDPISLCDRIQRFLEPNFIG
jgi:hypothetical protein